MLSDPLGRWVFARRFDGACSAVVASRVHAVDHPCVFVSASPEQRLVFVQHVVRPGDLVLELDATDTDLAELCVMYDRRYYGVPAESFDWDAAARRMEELAQTRTLIPYASRTGSRITLNALRAAGWRLLVSATGVQRHEGFPHCLDNGAWTAHQKQAPFDRGAFMRSLDLFGDTADFVVLPDIVAGGMVSYEMSVAWLEYVQARTRRALFSVQDGMDVSAVEALPLGDRLGIFVGGSTEWKERTMSTWGALGEARGAWVHVGRVNSARRIKLCADARATSFDGTSVTRAVAMLPNLDRARRMYTITVRGTARCV